MASHATSWISELYFDLEGEAKPQQAKAIRRFTARSSNIAANGGLEVFGSHILCQSHGKLVGKSSSCLITMVKPGKRCIARAHGPSGVDLS